jgi:hypothetical protein
MNNKISKDDLNSFNMTVKDLKEGNVIKTEYRSMLYYLNWLSKTHGFEIPQTLKNKVEQASN